MIWDLWSQSFAHFIPNLRSSIPNLCSKNVLLKDLTKDTESDLKIEFMLWAGMSMNVATLSAVGRVSDSTGNKKTNN